MEHIFAEGKHLEGLPENVVHKQRLELIKLLAERYRELLASISATGGSNLDKAANYSPNNRRQLEVFCLMIVRNSQINVRSAQLSRL